MASDSLFIILASIIISLSVHEAMHAFIAHKLGDPTAQEAGRLTLNPLKHIDAITTVLLPMILIIFNLPYFFAAKPVPFNPQNVKYNEFGAAIVGLVGPFSNLIMATITAIFIKTFGSDLGFEITEALITFIQINVAFFVFNMIPFPPLDGSRLLYAFSPEPIQKFMYQIETMGFGAILILMFVLFPIIGPLITHINQSLIRILL